MTQAKVEVRFSTGHSADVDSSVVYTESWSASGTSVSCSFAGGCTLALTGTRIGWDLDVEVLILGSYKCMKNAGNGKDEFNCEIPALPTQYSFVQFPELGKSIAWQSSGKVTITSENTSDAMKAFDEDPDTTSLTQASECSITLEVGDDHLATVDSVRLFLGDDSRFTKYVDGVIEYSNDKNTWS